MVRADRIRLHTILQDNHLAEQQKAVLGEIEYLKLELAERQERAVIRASAKLTAPLLLRYTDTY